MSGRTSASQRGGGELGSSNYNPRGNVINVNVSCITIGTGTDTFSATGSMIGARAFHVAVKLANGNVLVAGGRNTTTNYINTSEIYNPSTGTFTATGNMNANRGILTVTLL